MTFFSSLFVLLFISRFLENSLLSAEVKEGEILPPTIQKLMKGYNKYLRPFFDNGPVTVGMSLDIASIDTISEINMVRNRAPSHTTSVCMNARPDTIKGTLKNPSSHAHHRWSNRRILIFPTRTFSMPRITTTVACNMDLTKYPMDKQTCTLQLESWGYNINDVMFYWARGNDSVSGLDTLKLAQFTVEDHYTSVSEAVYETGVTTVLTMTTLMMGARTSLPNANCFIKAIDVYLGICFSFIFGALIEYAVAHFCTLQHPDYNNGLMYGHHMHECEEEMNGIVTTITSDSSRLKRRKDGPALVPTVTGEPGLTPSSPTASEPKTAEVPTELFSRCAKNISVLRKILRSINCCHVENPHYIDNYSRLTFPLSFIFVNLLYWTYYLYF
ncbi:hypothetical protein cypCar_00039951 [Cyprinus carpio]|nr:hypothetical protein cypCar_00039951 [Cyprinus carpio]